MQSPVPESRYTNTLKPVLQFLFWSVLFALVYAQKPLFTSNENHYFLKGLADAGYGFLAADWHATTLDPTPVFSRLIRVTYQLFHTMTPVYLYYALIMGVYLYSMAGIISHIFALGNSKLKRLVLIGSIILLHSAALRGALSVVIGPDWNYFFEGGVAGQRVLGEAFQPSVFAVFLLLSINLFLHGRPVLAAVLLPLVASMHPTYLLTAALLTIAYIGIEFFNTRDIKKALVIGLTSLLLVLPVLYHTVVVFAPQNAELYARTRQQMVNFRIPHHAVVAEWFNPSAVAAIVLVLAGMYLVRKSRLVWIMLVLLVFAVTLTLVQVAIDSDSLALLFPWRTSILLVPLASCALAGAGISALWARWGDWLNDHSRLLRIAVITALAALTVVGVYNFYYEWQQKQSAPENPMYEFVHQHAEAGQVYVIPVSMQDFRLATGVPAVAEFKSIPYQEEDFAEWLGRIHRVSYIYRQPEAQDTCERLSYIAVEFGATHIVLPQDTFGLQCQWLDEIYTDGFYSVREINLEQP